MNNQQYFHGAQQMLLSMNPRNLIAVCGRGFGKGAVQAGRLKTGFQGMPGGTGGFVAPSVKRCLTNILPSMLIHLEKWNYRRDVHYTVGKKPWKALHWKSPIFTPSNWENTISFYNGSVCNIISQDRQGTSNSMSLDYLIMDEAKFLDADQLRNETFPANRGNEMYFGDFFMHHGMTITSDMPVTQKGSWFLKYEDEMDTELIQAMWFVCNKIRAIHQAIAKDPRLSRKLSDDLDRWRKVLDSMRRDALLYVEFTTLENIDLLSEDFIRRMKRELSPGTFDTSIMTKRRRISVDGFYGALVEDVNYYTAPNVSYLDNMEYDFSKLQDVDCRMDSDLSPEEAIYVAFDANSNFNCLVAGQLEDSKLRIIKSFYTKFDRKLTELVDDFCRYYRWHKHKKVVFYYDATFKGSVTGKRENELYIIIKTAFRKNGWTVLEKFIGRPMGHIDKNLLITRMIKGKAKHSVHINRDNNEDLIIALESAAVRNGKKDKSGEKEDETDEDQLQHRTDFTDAFDTLLIGVECFPVFGGRTGYANTYPQ